MRLLKAHGSRSLMGQRATSRLRQSLPDLRRWAAAGLLCIPSLLASQSAVGQPAPQPPAAVPHITGYAPVGGAMMYYEVHGTGEPILFIHGGGGSLELWRNGGYIEELSKDHMVIVADSRGQGRSSEGPGPITYGRVGYDAIRLLDHLGIQRAHFVGHSSGGVAILHLLIDYSERIITATVSGVIYHVDNYRPEAYQAMKRQLEERLRAAERATQALTEGTVRAVEPPSEVAETARFEERLHKGAQGSEVAGAPRPPVWAASASTMRKFMSSWLYQPTLTLALLEQIDRPVLIVKGDRDPFMEPRVFDEIHEHIRGSKLLFCPDATHGVTQQCKDQMIPAIRAFIAQSRSGQQDSNAETKSRRQ